MHPSLLFTAASSAYLGNVVLGSGVKLRLFSTRSFRWVHHAVYITTCVLGAAAVSSLLWSEDVAGWVLLPAAIPLAALPYAASRSRRHVVVALLAAPFFLVSLIVSWR
ncbi:hypothetical protein [Planctomonas psychrotolerans]|uniref:hypothetical protein n=1 Tax=Planctomonas psychrotolerans TaxID=2528712 RepID=UPI001D0CE496|nr:hypothetical protein [Planctomonas psychrotolerans]